MNESDFRYFALNEISNLYPQINYDEQLDYHDIDCLFVCKNLQNIMGVFTSHYDDGLVFEVIYNGNSKMSTINSYRKIASNNFN